MVVTVALPTVPGREALLKRAMAAYRAQEGVLAEVMLFESPAACGYAWARVLESGHGDYVHFGADDLEPEPGAFMAAIDFVERGLHPAPLIFWPDGSLQSSGASWGALEEDGERTSLSRVPFVKRAWAPLLTPFPEEMHYYTDNLVCARLARASIPTVNCHAYAFTHHMAEPGRRNDTWARDRELYVRLTGEQP